MYAAGCACGFRFRLLNAPLLEVTKGETGTKTKLFYALVMPTGRWTEFLLGESDQAEEWMSNQPGGSEGWCKPLAFLDFSCL